MYYEYTQLNQMKGELFIMKPQEFSIVSSLTLTLQHRDYVNI